MSQRVVLVGLAPHHAIIKAMPAPAQASGITPEKLKTMLDAQQGKMTEAGFDFTPYLFEEEDEGEAVDAFVKFLNEKGPFDAICIGAGQSFCFDCR